jgi:hypothetical protein
VVFQAVAFHLLPEVFPADAEDRRRLGFVVSRFSAPAGYSIFHICHRFGEIFKTVAVFA